MANPLILRRGTKTQLDAKVLYWAELAIADDEATGHTILAIGDGVTAGGKQQLEFDENGALLIDGGEVV